MRKWLSSVARLGRVARYGRAARQSCEDFAHTQPQTNEAQCPTQLYKNTGITNKSIKQPTQIRPVQLISRTRLT